MEYTKTYLHSLAWDSNMFEDYDEDRRRTTSLQDVRKEPQPESSMSFFSWNCHGLGLEPSTQQYRQQGCDLNC
ncbi:hypothetical protein FRX31_005751 [Thalictrum thalictroides]|uniref:Uncharacterized protein n=1 Tax=Thalictrum thalictroides TaxID=46969 RepID=A0A7J6X4I3_THATH|nr:hypothetical protein FRX31_005751 [Thalictrum thalictroides]